MNEEKFITVMQDDDWDIRAWHFRNVQDAYWFIYSKIENVCNDCNLTLEDIDWYVNEETNEASFRFDWYNLWLTTTYLYNSNPNKNDWTKEFRGNTERSRQEDRTTPWDWWEA